MIPLPDGVPVAERQTGADWLATQDADTQRRILGVKGQALYADGTPLSKWARVSEDADWGPVLRTANLKELAA